MVPLVALESAFYIQTSPDTQEVLWLLFLSRK